MTPRINHTLAESYTVFCPRRDHYATLALQCLDQLGPGSRPGVAVPEIAIVSETPGVDVSLAVDCEAMIGTERKMPYLAGVLHVG